MPTSRPRTAAPSTTGRRVVRALASAAALCVLVAGLPWLLGAATAAAWQPGIDAFTHLFSRTDTFGAFILALCAVGWISWASFALSLLLEIPAQLRGRSAPRLPGLQISQRAAASLVGGILVLLPTGTALASPAAAQATSASAEHIPGPASPTASRVGHTAATQALAPDEERTAPSGQRTYTVRETRPAESLWSIAEQLTGHGDLYTKIAAANEGHRMADGSTFHTDQPIQPGWVLQLPADLPLLDTDSEGMRTQHARTAPASAEHSYTVRSDDSLWGIAEDQYDDGTQYQEIFEANRGKPQPGGGELRDPDEIEVGWKLTIPQQDTDDPPAEADGGDSAPPPPATGDDRTGSDRDTSGSGDTGDKSPTPTPSPSDQEDGTGAGGAHKPGGQDRERQTPSATPASPGSAQPSTPEPSRPSTPQATPPSATPSKPPTPNAPSTPTTPSTPSADSPAAAPDATPAGSSRSGVELRTIAGAFALLAAALTGALALRRMLQRRRRKPGETIAIAEETAPAVAQIAQVSEPTLTDELDIALRTLAARSQAANLAVPPLRGARLGQRSIDVLPADPDTAPMTPFAAGQDGWWTLTQDAELLSLDEARQSSAPYPLFVSIGATESNECVLLNLDHPRVVLLEGTENHIREVCTSLALELSMSPWADHCEIVTLGFGEELPQLLPTSRIAHKRQPAHAVRDLADWILSAYQLPDEAEQPYLLMCAATLDGDTAWQIAEALDKAGDLPVTLIAPAASASRHFAQAEVLNASDDQLQDVDCLGLPLILQRLEESAYEQFAAELRISGQPSVPAQGAWQNVPAEPIHTPLSPAPAAQSEGSNQALEPAAESSVAAPDATPDAAYAQPYAGTASGTETLFPSLLSASSDPAGLQAISLPSPGTEVDTHPGHPGPAGNPEDDAQAATAWNEDSPATSSRDEQDLAPPAADLHSPEIRVLGPVEVTGVPNSGHGPRQAQLAALLYFKPGRSGDTLCFDMDPYTPWSRTTLNTRMGDLRRSLGDDPQGDEYVPRRKTGDDPYAISPRVRCDWTRFKDLAERALAHGPTAVQDLERALVLVRGKPFGERPLAWAEPHQQEMITRIIDVVHTIASWRIQSGQRNDLSAARQAVCLGLEVDDSAELLYRDLLRIEHALGNRSGLHTVIARVQQAARAHDCPLEIETEQLIHDLLGSGPRRAQSS